MVYGIIAVPLKPDTGRNVTWPVLVSSAQIPLPATVRVVCWPGAVGSRSMVLGTSVAPLPPAVSFAAGVKIAGFVPVVVVASLLAVGAAGALTVIDRIAT